MADNAHLTKYEPDRQGQYYILDTTIDPTQTATVDAMNGRQGDTMRRVPIAFVDDDQPHDLTNSTVELRAQDGAGVVKISDMVLNWVSRTGGLIVFGIPAQFYKNPGEYQHAYFVISDKDSSGNTTSTSTVNVDFSVVEDGVEVSDVDSTIYISSVDRLLNQAKSRIEAVKIAGSNAEAIVQGYEKLIQSNAFPTPDGNNNFTGSNSFADLTVDSLSNKQLSDVSNAVVTAQTTANSASLQAVSNSTLISNNTDSIVANSTAISSADVRLTSAETSIAAVSSAVKNTDNKLSSLASSIDNLDTSSSSNTDVTSSLAHVNNSLISLSTEIDTLSTAVSNIPNFTTSINAVSAIASQALSTANTAQQNDNNLSATLSDVQDNVTNISNTSYATSVNIDNLFSAVTALINTVNQNIDNKKIDGNDVQHISKQS
ncbi:BppU family phage baseplate upper protein [Limosilactobacillus reuteri]|uniref:BppU family phage baseplate upper protein n=1 Tax=Limosilactobacillus reuteri TaxID=1598 RepID=UPI0011577C35|nr:BppU family phage baseplate upper protein [Limosilactobacillus reuteri]QDK48690.1 hypothetical protein DPH67_06170 [Limosilactobacillus reuteri]